MNRRAFLDTSAGLVGSLAGCSSGLRRSPTSRATPAPVPSERPSLSGTGELNLPVPTSELVPGAPRDAIPAIDEPAFGTDCDTRTEIRLTAVEQVIGIESAGVVRAYPISAVREERVVNDIVGGRPVVVTLGSLGDTLVAYDRRVDGETLVFVPASGNRIRGAGFRWDVASGRAVDGPYLGQELRPATDRSPMFWFAWLAFHPETEVYGQSATG